MLALMKACGRNEVPICEVDEKDVLDPAWYARNNITVQKSMPRGSVNPDSPPEIHELYRLQNLKSIDPEVPKHHHRYFDDIHNGVTICGHPVTGKVVSGFCNVKTMHQFQSTVAAINVASYLRRLGPERRAELFEEGAIQVFLSPSCLEHEPSDEAAQRLRRWYVGDGASNVGVKKVIEQAIITGTLQLDPGVHGSVFYEGGLVGTDDVYSSHACLSVFPIAGTVAGTGATRDLFLKTAVPYYDYDGTPILPEAGASLLIALDCQSQSLQRLTNRQSTMVKRQLKAEQERLRQQAQARARPPPTDQSDRSEYDRMCAAHDAREARELEQRRGEVLARRIEIKKHREAAATQKAINSAIYTPSGPSHKKKEASIAATAGLDKQAKEASRRSSSIEDAAQHELELKAAEGARVAALEAKRDALRIANEIGGSR